MEDYISINCETEGCLCHLITEDEVKASRAQFGKAVCMMCRHRLNNLSEPLKVKRGRGGPRKSQ